ncbi:MAG: class I SAM-dependent methyltransferase [Spongiibacteraceae bacterium]
MSATTASSQRGPASIHPIVDPGVEDRALLALAKMLRAADYRFITGSPASHARVNQREGNQWARNVVDVLGWSRPFHVEILPPAIFALMQAAAVIQPFDNGWRSTVRFSTLPGSGSRQELLVHSAYPTLDSDAVFFGPDTYRFNRALLHFLDRRERTIGRALDVGTGSGAGAIVIARESPGAVVIASDINTHALRLARVNVLLAEASGVTVQHSDLFERISGDFDLIVANPPFLIDPEQRAYRHGGGARGEGFTLTLLQAALPRLVSGGTLLIYTGVAIVDGVDPLLARLRNILTPLHLQWTYREVDPDIFGEELAGETYADTDRIAAVVLTVTSTNQ